MTVSVPSSGSMFCNATRRGVAGALLVPVMWDAWVGEDVNGVGEGVMGGVSTMGSTGSLYSYSSLGRFPINGSAAGCLTLIRRSLRMGVKRKLFMFCLLPKRCDSFLRMIVDLTIMMVEGKDV